ncbi:MAG TPA: 3-deoxy-D-manno-octulosonic acid transferase [Gammaproteobacteria bacterium]|nr:3-deoxy-D-manno-octulosonic acid transferase [Gammaproteobacteria bacterium]
MRHLYSGLLYLITPCVVLRLLWRSRRAPDYRRRWGERFGWVPVRDQPCVWLHAVSVGEVQAAAPLIEWLLARGEAVLVTTTTPTGSERVRSLFGGRVAHCYLPYDLPGAVARFLKRIRPRLGVIMETELWPNLFRACRRAEVPLVLANGRLSERSAAGYRRLGGLAREVVRDLSVIIAQGQADAGRFLSLGAEPERVRVSGNIKYDLSFQPGTKTQAGILRRMWGEARPVWIAASTHAGEDEPILEAHARVRRRLPEALLVLVPRHPERFDAVAELCARRGCPVVRRTEWRACERGTQVFLGDTMGELPMMYAASDVAFVGGSLVPTGGHNVLEPAALGVPVVVGPHIFNFAAISDALIAAGAAVRVMDAGELAGAVHTFLVDPDARRSAGARGAAWVANNRGALRRVQDIVEAFLVGAWRG